MESKWDALSALGAITAAWLLLTGTWGVARAVYVYLLPQVRRGNAWLRAQGAWAVVTGATSGIGKAYAHELARRGLDIVLISRSLSKLEQEAREIERLHGRSTRIIQADFTGGLEIYGAIEAGLRGLEIGVLVNNVGMAYGGRGGVFRKLLDLEDLGQSVSDIINCNAMSVAQVSRAMRAMSRDSAAATTLGARVPWSAPEGTGTPLAVVMLDSPAPASRLPIPDPPRFQVFSPGSLGALHPPDSASGLLGLWACSTMPGASLPSPNPLRVGLLLREGQSPRPFFPGAVTPSNAIPCSRGKGVIINVSSQAGCRRGIPLRALYSATKAFVRFFSEAVCEEYLPQGITIQTVSPMLVSTNMTHNLPTGLLVKDADEFAREALDTLGLSSHVSGCLGHAVQSFLLPFGLLRWFLHSRQGVSLLSAGSKSNLPSLKPQST
ncbi:17-beta-hydroxysteroid dehydrogenase type 3-like [Cavia porcellus]|uniref:17-beta-hydroxysteroid dehydrogenase type 3-like n=1 Tax=Cavia porcellus TaxID=10141 RepID=UPI002FDF5063